MGAEIDGRKTTVTPGATESASAKISSHHDTEHNRAVTIVTFQCHYALLSSSSPDEKWAEDLAGVRALVEIEERR